MPREERGQTESESWRAPTRSGVALAMGVVVVTAVVAAPQFVLAPHVLAVVLTVGSVIGTGAALLSQYRPLSRSFLVLAIPLVFLAVVTLRDRVGIAPPTMLVGLSALVVAGIVTDRVLETR